jgi:hypothetical protein
LNEGEGITTPNRPCSHFLNLTVSLIISVPKGWFLPCPNAGIKAQFKAFISSVLQNMVQLKLPHPRPRAFSHNFSLFSSLSDLPQFLASQGGLYLSGFKLYSVQSELLFDTRRFLLDDHFSLVETPSCLQNKTFGFICAMGFGMNLDSLGVYRNMLNIVAFCGDSKKFCGSCGLPFVAENESDG